MNDCPNADVRDLLPDLLHARLDAGTRAMVEAHVAGCADCAAELELLRQLRALRGTPKVDVASIVAALPAYRAPARRSWVSWRAAAVITVMVAGASSVAVLQHDASRSVRVAPAIALPAAIPVAPDASAPATDASNAAPAAHTKQSGEHTASVPHSAATTHTPAVDGPVRELAMGGGALSDLDDRELTSLLKDIESLDAVPSVEVESAPTAPIAPSAPAGP